MYEELMNEVHRQWLHEFDIEAARRRQLPRKQRRLLWRRNASQ